MHTFRRCMTSGRHLWLIKLFAGRAAIALYALCAKWKKKHAADTIPRFFLRKPMQPVATLRNNPPLQVVEWTGLSLCNISLRGNWVVNAFRKVASSKVNPFMSHGVSFFWDSPKIQCSARCGRAGWVAPGLQISLSIRDLAQAVHMAPANRRWLQRNFGFRAHSFPWR